MVSTSFKSTVKCHNFQLAEFSNQDQQTDLIVSIINNQKCVFGISVDIWGLSYGIFN